MTPDEIKAVILDSFPNILTDVRSGNGWSFFYGEIRKRRHSTRIARVLPRREGRSNAFKLSATSRLSQEEVAYEITSPEQLRKFFEEELRIWKENFEV